MFMPACTTSGLHLNVPPVVHTRISHRTACTTNGSALESTIRQHMPPVAHTSITHMVAYATGGLHLNVPTGGLDILLYGTT
ncbi:hypothetical protein AVEN_42698-1 [Araneus ventricosus]|uniref:Uncharacterized protein n=1 Tax=Araneus ventricosus TaxID=182803 RepID=A0A4Y2BPA0_ARAVE|nr:hypothetical protein AVEN_42698-1 [Araneus ventricosus]